MANLKIKDCFNGRFFEIPRYQRGYAWEKRNVRELFDDIFESIETGSSHYIGTLVLSRHPTEEDHYFVVDGQQRIATITMIINELIKYLPKSDLAYYRRFYIVEDRKFFRLKTLGKDSKYFSDILRGKVIEPQSKSQRLIKEAYEEIQTIVQGVGDKQTFLKNIEKLEAMEFIEQSEGDAIRIFQTVNDRGKLLSNMEKTKSLLIYFSNRYLKKKLDDRINDLFGEIFEIYDDIKHIGETQGITLIRGTDFDEDNIMRYHFVSYSDANYDATAPYVLMYLKRRLTDYRKDDKDNDFVNMEKFIDGYVSSLHSFFYSLRKILRRILNNEKYYKLFVVLGLSATLYPLIVKLEMLGVLETELPSERCRGYTFLDLLELIEARVYKTRGTDPRADISQFTYEVDDKWTVKYIQDWLLWYNQNWMSKERFQTELQGYIYGNRALAHMFIDYCEQLEKRKFSLDELKEIVSKAPTIEHVLSKTPKFTYKSVGFRSTEHFLECEDTLGNLTILEKNLNSAVQNKNPTEKIPFYDRSLYKMTKNLSTLIHTHLRFTRKEIENRSEEISGYLSKRWWC